MTATIRLLLTLCAAGICANACGQGSGHDADSRKSTAIPVTVVSTETAFADDEKPAYSYPRAISLPVPSFLAGQVGAYGAAGVLWLGPKSWTGNANVGIDGNTFVSLHPQGRSSEASPRITYTILPACVACILGAAAPYFPEAQKDYEDEYNEDGKNPVHIPAGLKVALDLPHVVTYTLPNANGLLTRGAANFSGIENYSETRIVLSEHDAALAGFLIERFEDSLIEGAGEQELVSRIGDPSQTTNQNGLKTLYYDSLLRGRITIRIVNGKATLH